MPNIEIVGLDRLVNGIRSIPNDLRPFVIRGIAAKPAQRAARKARTLLPIGDSGKTASSIGVLRVRNPKQTYVEVGFRGRSVGYIYISKDTIHRANRGDVKGFPWLFRRAGESLGEIKREMAYDFSQLFARTFKRAIR